MTLRAEPTAIITGPVQHGQDVYVGHYTIIAAAQDIRIGSHVAIAAQVWIGDQDHDLEGDIFDCGVVRPVVIGNDVWIGAGAKILKGVQLGDGCVVGAGAVVTGSRGPFPPGAILKGNPARVTEIRPGYQDPALAAGLQVLQAAVTR